MLSEDKLYFWLPGLSDWWSGLRRFNKSNKKPDLASVGSKIDPSLTFYPYISHYPLFILHPGNFIFFIFILPLTHTHNFIFIFRRSTFRGPPSSHSTQWCLFAEPYGKKRHHTHKNKALFEGRGEPAGAEGPTYFTGFKVLFNLRLFVWVRVLHHWFFVCLVGDTD